MSQPPGRSDLLAGIAEVARDHLALHSPLQESQRLIEDLGFDSLKLLTLAAEVENRFRIRIEAGDEAALATVGDLIDLLERKLSLGAARPGLVE